MGKAKVTTIDVLEKTVVEEINKLIVLIKTTTDNEGETSSNLKRTTEALQILVEDNNLNSADYMMDQYYNSNC